MHRFHELIYLVPFILYLVAHFSLSQKIYYYNRFLHALAAALLISLLLFSFSPKEDYRKATLSVSFLFFYILLLWFIKKTYKNLNGFFIKKSWIKSRFADKDFTWVETSDSGDDIWNKKIAAPPSTLDYILSFILLIVPIILTVVLGSLISFLL